ncbi:hypothetical protein [Mycoplasma struthionis]|uniref:Uncharacterized protein n=1 Tax=Mycoplasma struthionis TaxID=538220 RepID=A0A3G8LH21_9MOLU|nr:hypothetical protein [Mycoplasma struthionis]AZG68535.1 hypothetical protein EGN60_00920 [Mycoplasma struthionis]TPI02362.1 hypothetical protein FJM01_00730 [Mycoplasma struthionis]
MSNNAKWKNKKLNVNSYVEKDTTKKQKLELSSSWKIALTGLFLVVIPSFLVMVLAGNDGWVFSQTKNFNRWAVQLPIALGMFAFQFAIIALLVWKFKVLETRSISFLIPVALAMNSFIVSGNVDAWFWRVLPAVGLALVSIPILMLHKTVNRRKLEKQRKLDLEEEKKNKSLLD